MRYPPNHLANVCSKTTSNSPLVTYRTPQDMHGSRDRTSSFSRDFRISTPEGLELIDPHHSWGKPHKHLAFSNVPKIDSSEYFGGDSNQKQKNKTNTCFGGSMVLRDQTPSTNWSSKIHQTHRKKRNALKVNGRCSSITCTPAIDQSHGSYGSGGIGLPAGTNLLGHLGPLPPTGPSLLVERNCWLRKGPFQLSWLVNLPPLTYHPQK